MAAFLTGAGAVSALAAEGYANGGYWSNQDTMEWTLQNGTAEVYGRGPVFSELHPEITDPEHYFRRKVLPEQGGRRREPGKGKFDRRRGKTIKRISPQL